MEYRALEQVDGVMTGLNGGSSAVGPVQGVSSPEAARQGQIVGSCSGSALVR